MVHILLRAETKFSRTRCLLMHNGKTKKLSEAHRQNRTVKDQRSTTKRTTLLRFSSFDMDGGGTSLSEAASPSIFYNGSIPDAIAEAKAGEKILVVYVAGSDDLSKQLENTWRDPKVVEKAREDCIALRLEEGSSDAAHYSCLYPIPCVPSVDIIGHNGSRVASKGGFMKSQEFLVILEEAKHRLQVQKAEAAAAFIAMLSSSNVASFPPEQVPLSSPLGPTLIVEEGRPCSPSSSTPGHPESIAPASGAISDETRLAGVVPEDDVGQVDECPPKDSDAFSDKDLTADAEESGSLEEMTTSISKVVSIENKAEELDRVSVGVHAGCSSPAEKHLSESVELVRGRERTPGKVTLKVFLPDGKVVQGEFCDSDSLMEVKRRVDAEWNGAPYKLAVRIPRREFSERDMEKSLSELKLMDRDGLIVVLVPGSIVTPAAFSSSLGATTNQPSIFWRLLSFVNPLTYLSGRGGQIPDESSDRPMAVRSREAVVARVRGAGGNIHTLRTDEQEDNRGANMFWNGNSTQFGGDAK